jgi:hypothetical protein
VITKYHKVVNPNSNPQLPWNKVERLVHLGLLEPIAQQPIVESLVPAPRCLAQTIQRLLESNHMPRTWYKALGNAQVDLLVERSVEESGDHVHMIYL